MIQNRLAAADAAAFPELEAVVKSALQELLSSRGRTFHSPIGIYRDSDGYAVVFEGVPTKVTAQTTEALRVAIVERFSRTS
jgi:hypothetical protein